MRPSASLALLLLATLVAAAPAAAIPFDRPPVGGPADGSTRADVVVLPQVPVAYDIKIPAKAHVTIDVEVIRGSVLTLEVTGPAGCRAGIPEAVAIDRRTGTTTFTLDCGVVPAGGDVLTITAEAALAHVAVYLHGAKFDVDA